MLFQGHDDAAESAETQHMNLFCSVYKGKLLPCPSWRRCTTPLWVPGRGGFTASNAPSAPLRHLVGIPIAGACSTSPRHSLGCTSCTVGCLCLAYRSRFNVCSN